MADISKHPLIRDAYEVCRAIKAIRDRNGEAVCSDSHAHAAMLAEDLMTRLDKFVDLIQIH